MSMDVTKEEKIELVSDWTETDGIFIRVIVRDGTLMEIGFKIKDAFLARDTESNYIEFLLPHGNNLNSLRGLHNQLAEIIIRLEREMDIAHDASQR